MQLTTTDRETRFAQGLACPHCQHMDVMRWGHQRGGAQRYRCRRCRRTFNDLTGTPLARTRQGTLWPLFAECMRNRLSCRRTAQVLGFNHKTAWCWRHRLLAVLAPQAETPMTGIVEADEMFVRSNFKRLTPAGRRRRKRGGDGSKRGLGKDKVAVLVARSRAGQVRVGVLPRPTIAAITATLAAVVQPTATLVTDASQAMRGAARALGVAKHVALTTKYTERRQGVHHIQHVNAHHSRIRAFLAPFRGVATKYLHRYLQWQLYDDQTRAMGPPEARAILLQRALPAEPHCPYCGGRVVAA